MKAKTAENIFPTEEEMKNALRLALQKFFLNDSFLIHNDVHERTLTFRLGIYLQELFPSWNVDCEYNRNRRAIKKITTCREQPRAVFPDIIIHRRGTAQNLLVIEAKKNANKQDKEADIKKIEEYLNDPTLKYRYGLFLDFNDFCQETIQSLENNWWIGKNG